MASYCTGTLDAKESHRMNLSMKPKVLVFTDWYLPGFNAGGPIRSVSNMIKKLQDIIAHHEKLGSLMSQPYAMNDMKEFTLMAREHSSLLELVEQAKQFIQNSHQLQEYEEILLGEDEELKELVKEEIVELQDTLKCIRNTYFSPSPKKDDKKNS